MNKSIRLIISNVRKQLQMLGWDREWLMGGHLMPFWEDFSWNGRNEKELQVKENTLQHKCKCPKAGKNSVVWKVRKEATQQLTCSLKEKLTDLCCWQTHWYAIAVVVITNLVFYFPAIILSFCQNLGMQIEVVRAIISGGVPWGMEWLSNLLSHSWFVC